MRSIWVAILIVATVTMPLASSDTIFESQEAETCHPADESDRSVRVSDETFYFRGDSIWRERNGEAGMQSSAGACHVDDDGIPDNVWSPDQPVFSAGA